MDNQFKNLKNNWKSAHLKAADEVRRQIDSDRIKKVKSNRQKLSRTYLRLICVAAVMILLYPEMCLILHMPQWSFYYSSVFFTIMGILMFLVYNLLRSLKPESVTAVEALKKIKWIIRLRLVQQIVGTILALPIVIAVFKTCLGDTVAFSGALLGLLVGVIVGVTNYRRTQAQLIEIRNQFKEDDTDC